MLFGAETKEDCARDAEKESKDKSRRLDEYIMRPIFYGLLISEIPPLLHPDHRKEEGKEQMINSYCFSLLRCQLIIKCPIFYISIITNILHHFYHKIAERL
jgi:hypothetical protein